MKAVIALIRRYPEHRRAIAIAALGHAIALCDMLGADADGFLANLRATTLKPDPLFPKVSQ